MDVPLSVMGAAIANLLYALLGIAVLAASPRAPANRAFALFTVASGAAGVVVRAAGPLGVDAAGQLAGGILYALGAVGVLALARVVPEPLAPRDRRSWKFAMGLGAIVFALFAARIVGEPSDVPAVTARSLGLVALMAVSTAATVLFAARASRSPAFLSSYAAMSLAVFLPTAIVAGSALHPGEGDLAATLFVGVGGLMLLSAVVAWSRVPMRQPGSRWPILVCWASLAAALLAQVATRTTGAGLGSLGWESTVALVRLSTIAVLAFLILRGQVPGLETKVRWTVSRGTIAGAFVAAFFLASEGAQILFGAENEWLGLLGAGALVFAIAPLQRAAERLAERAVPVAAARERAGEAAPAGARAEGSFRKAVRLALRDRRLTREEEGHLHELARDLGLDGARAHAIVVEVERETEGAVR